MHIIINPYGTTKFELSSLSRKKVEYRNFISVNPQPIVELQWREIDSVTETDRCARHTPRERRGRGVSWNRGLKSELLGLTGERQCGFRPGLSTADATQVIIRIEEYVEDLRKRRLGKEEEGHKDSAVKLLDLRKTYP